MLGHELEARARDAGYVAIGFCVLGVQQLQVLRRELAGELVNRAGTLGGHAARGAASSARLRDVVRQAEAITDPVLDGVEKALPGTARSAVHQGRTAAKVLRRMLL